MEKLIGIKEAAAIIGMSPELLRYYVNKDKGPKSEKIGRYIFLYRQSVKKWKKPMYEKPGPKL